MFPPRHSFPALAALVLLAGIVPSMAQDWKSIPIPAAGCRMDFPGEPKMVETVRIEEIEALANAGSMTLGMPAAGGEENYLLSFVALEKATGDAQSVDAIMEFLIKRLTDELAAMLQGKGGNATGEPIEQAGLKGKKLLGQAKNPAHTVEIRVLRGSGRFYITMAVAPADRVARFMDSLELAPVKPAPADPANARRALVPDWRRVTLKEAACEIDLPGKVNMLKSQRITQPEGKGFVGVEGMHNTSKTSAGIFLVLYGTLTGSKGSPQEMRRMVQFLSSKVDELVRKEFLKVMTEKWTRPVKQSSATVTDTAYFTQTTALDCRMRKVVLADRAYFLLGIGAPADVNRFFASLTPISPAGGTKP